jgi:hypothetical protein
MVRQERQAIITVYHSGVFIVAPERHERSAGYQAPTAIKTAIVRTDKQTIVAGTESQSGVSLPPERFFQQPKAVGAKKL